VIWLLRHADAEDGTPDAQRPLSRKGERQAAAAAAALTALDLGLDACVTSPKVRARDTARVVCEALGLEAIEDRRLEGGPFDASEIAGEHGDRVLLVGHDPDFSMAVHSLTGAQVRMPKSGVAAIDRGELIALLRPSELAVLARAAAR
jgi:phosphohistidine phosphatase